MANKLIDLAGLKRFWKKAKEEYITPALLNGELNFEYLTTTYFWGPNRPPYGDYMGQPSEPQGIAYIGNNKIMMSACSARPSNINMAPLLTDNTAFQIFGGINRPQYATFEATRNVAGLGHANSMTIDPETNTIYIPIESYSTKSGNTYTAQRSKVIKKLTLDIDDNYKFTDAGSIAVNTTQLESQIKTKYNSTVTIDSVGFVAYDKIDKKLYIWVGSHYLATVEPSTGVATLVSKFTEPQTIGGGQQGFAVMGDLVFIVKHFPNQIWVYSISQDKIIRCYTVPQYDCFGHQINYVEGIDYDPSNGNFYIATFVMTHYWKRNEGQCRRVAYTFRFNPFKDRPGAFNAFSSSQDKYDNYYSSDSNAVANVCAVPAAISPIHQRGDHYFPFGTISEAITAIQSGKFPQAYYIDIHEGSSGSGQAVFYEYVTIRNCNIMFTGAEITKIHGLDIQNSTVFFNQKITIDGAMVTNAAPLRIHNSKVFFNGYSITVPADFEESVSYTGRTCLYAVGSEIDNNVDAECSYDGGAYTHYDIVLNRSQFKSQASTKSKSDTKAIRLSSSEWKTGYPPTDNNTNAEDNANYAIHLFGSNKGQFTANKLVGNTSGLPIGNMQAVVVIKYNNVEHFFTSGVRYKGTDSLDLFTHTPHGTVKTVVNANGKISSTAFEGTQPSAVTLVETRYVRYV